MGRCKQLLPLGGTTVIGRCITTILAAGIADCTVVVSSNGEAVAAEARRFPVRVVVNTECAGDMASSVRAGRDAIAADRTGVLVALCDYPLVQPSTIRLLAAAAENAPDRIIIPTDAGRRGHPLLFPRAVLDELTPDRILRDVVRSDPARILELPVIDPGIHMDMDTPEQFRLICRHAGHEDESPGERLPFPSAAP
jgi:molybdenum cofactor cytidylyltransferase